MQISKKIRLEISPQDAAALEFMQAKCRGLYNWWVMRLRNGELWPGTLVAKKTLKESRKYDPELNYVYNKLTTIAQSTFSRGTLPDWGHTLPLRNAVCCRRTVLT